jgi:uncharacterized protein YciI
VDEHAAFMTALADRGFILAAGPLAGTEHGRVRVLLILNAEDEDEIDRRLAGDPWVQTGQLVTATIEPWQILVGADRLPYPLRLKDVPSRPGRAPASSSRCSCTQAAKAGSLVARHPERPSAEAPSACIVGDQGADLAYQCAPVSSSAGEQTAGRAQHTRRRQNLRRFRTVGE